MRLSDLVEKARHDFGINIDAGHIRGAGIRGQYDTGNKGIRTKIANDLPTISHELGHHLDNLYQLTGESLPQELRDELLEGVDAGVKAAYAQQEWLGEALAEYVRKFLQNRETAAIDYPSFTKYFLNAMSGRDAALLTQFADEVNAYYALDADTAQSSLRSREDGPPDMRTAVEKIADMGDDMYQAWIDSNHGIKLFDKAVGSKVHVLATNSAYSDAVAGQILTGDLTDINGKYVGPGLKAALHGVNTRSKKEYAAFNEYLTMRHGVEYLAEGMRVFADDRKNSTAFMTRRQEELEKEYPHFKEAAQRLYQFLGDFNRMWGVDTQLLGQKQLESWQKRWPNYVPFNRAIPKTAGAGRAGAKRGFANQNAPYKRAKGSGLDIYKPVDNIIDNIVLLVNAGVRNNVMFALRNAALELGADAAFMERIDPPMKKKTVDIGGVKETLAGEIRRSDMTEDDKSTATEIISKIPDLLHQFEPNNRPHDNIITVLVKGKPELWKINDELLLESITNMSPGKAEGVLRVYAATTRFMTANITGNNPIWSVFSNAPRDLMTFLVYSKDRRLHKAMLEIGRAYLDAFNHRWQNGKGVDPLYLEYLAMGGGQTSVYSADRDLAKQARRKLSGSKAQRVMDIANPLNWLEFVTNTIEMGPRHATYRLMRQAGLDAQEAYYEAMDVTTNFRRGGTEARKLNKLVPFFNAGLQGLDKHVRHFCAEDAPRDRRAKIVMSRWASYIASFAILGAVVYALNNRDEKSEKDYQQLSNYTKNVYWCIPLGDGQFFAIPKPRDLGVPSSLVETFLEYTHGENKHAFDEFYDYATDNFLPGVASDLVQLPSNIAREGSSEGLKSTVAGVTGSFGLFGVFAYMVANRDFLGKPIESAAMTSVEPKDRFNDKTSKIAHWMGKTLGLSPVKVDYFGNSVLGYLWKTPRALLPVGEDPDYTLGVASSYLKDNLYSQDLVNWLYDEAEKSAMAKNSAPNDMEKVIKAKQDETIKTFYGRYNSLSKLKVETDTRRRTRQAVMDVIHEYRKAVDSQTTTKVQNIVLGVVRETKDASYLPAVMQTYAIDGKGLKHNLSDAQYVDYQTNYLSRYWGYIEANLSQGMDVKGKAAVISAAQKVAREQAANQVLTRLGAPLTKYAEKYAGVSDEDVVMFLALLELVNTAGPGIDQKEATAALQGMEVSDTTKAILWQSANGQWTTKNNPWSGYLP